ncbi:hypothetical protein AVL50_08955 [Flammeovirga sp. SJP92]|nr:hypothetical protein AVL50_08955 [Flammeovirga sp. SJP92]
MFTFPGAITLIICFYSALETLQQTKIEDKMKKNILTWSKIILISFFVIIPLFSFSQEEYLSRLSLAGTVSEFAVSPSEEIWVATSSGNVYYTKGVGKLWHLGPFGSLEYNPYQHRTKDEFKRIYFISEDKMMISGYLNDDDTNRSFVYWSENHGESWDKVYFNERNWFKNAYTDNKGKVWLIDSYNRIYFSNDSCKTWQPIEGVNIKDFLPRILSVHFSEDGKTGIFGAFDNNILQTKNNCKTWEKVPSPLDQNKYKKLSKNEDTRIRKVRVFGDYFILKQNGKLFYTNRNSIDWQYVSRVSDFEVSENGQFYTINHDYSISIYDASFLEIWKSNEVIDDELRAITVKNNSLFVLTYDNLYKIDEKEFKVSPIFTDEQPIKEPYRKINYKGQLYGFWGEDILHFDQKLKLWSRLMTADFSVGEAKIVEDKLLITDRECNKNYFVDIENRALDEYIIRDHLFSGLIAQELHFELTSDGCFHSEDAIRVYTKNADKFVIDNKRSTSDFLSDALTQIDYKQVEQLIRTVDQSRSKMVSINDLNITKNDVKNFIQFIDYVEAIVKKNDVLYLGYESLYDFPGEYSDFNFYRSIADSLSTLTKEEINDIFSQASGNHSTTTDIRRIKIVFQNGKQLTIENYDDEPNYLYTPWVVDFEGVKFRMNSILFGQHIEEITNCMFFTDDVKNINYAIFKIANYLYRKKLN